MTQIFTLIPLNWESSENLAERMQGVYQIYGDSPIYGLNSLLYIGKSKDIQRRLSEHLEHSWHIKVQPNLKFFFASVEDSEMLDLVEETLICLHKPSLNSDRIARVKLHEVAIYIQNWGNRGALPIECTNYYYLNDGAKK